MMSTEEKFRALYECWDKSYDTEKLQSLFNRYRTHEDFDKLIKMSHKKDGVTVLHMVAGTGLDTIVEFLMHEKECDVLKEDNDGWNVVHYAVKHKGNQEVLRKLLSKKGCFNMFDKSTKKMGYTPFVCSLDNKSTEAAKYLLKLDGEKTIWSDTETYRIDFQETISRGHSIYEMAMEINDPELIRLLIEKDHDWKSHVLMGDDGKRAIVIAAKHQKWRSLDVVLAQHDLKLESADMKVVLKEICINNNKKLLESILKKQRDTFVKIDLESDFLHSVLSSGGRSPEIIEILIEYGVDVTGVNAEGQNILHVIASNGDTRILSSVREKLSVMKRKGIFQDLLDQNCRTYKKQIRYGQGKLENCERSYCYALHIATVNMHVDLVNRLLSFGADPLVTDGSRQSPIEIVIELISKSDEDYTRKLQDISTALCQALVSLKNKPKTEEEVQLSSRVNTVDGKCEEILEVVGRLQREGVTAREEVTQYTEKVCSLLEEHKEKTIRDTLTREEAVEKSEVLSVQKEKQQLCKACFKGQVDLALITFGQEELDLSRSVHYKDSDIVWLQRAAYNDNRKVVKEFLKQGCDVTALDDEGQNILHWAVCGNKGIGVLQLLLKREDCFPLFDQSSNKRGFTPFVCASENQNTDAMKGFLQRHGESTPWDRDKEYKIDFEAAIDCSDGIYQQAMVSDDPSLVELLKDKDTNWETNLMKEIKGIKPVVVAAKENRWKSVRFVMLNGHPLLDDSDLEVILMEMWKDNQEFLLKELVPKFCGKNKSKLRTTLLHSVVSSPLRSRDLVAVLMRHEMDVKGINENSQNILHVLAGNGDMGILSVIEEELAKTDSNKLYELLEETCTWKVVIQFGDQTYKEELKECSALHIAAANMHLDMVTQFLRLKMDPQVKDGKGQTPRDIAHKLLVYFEGKSDGIMCQLKEIRKKLQMAEPELTAADRQGNTWNKQIEKYFENITDTLKELSKADTFKEKLIKYHKTFMEDRLQTKEDIKVMLDELLKTESFEEKIKEYQDKLLEKHGETMEGIKEAIAVTKVSLSGNEIAQFEAMNAIARVVGREPPKDKTPVWELMVDKLFQGHCVEEFVREIKEKAREGNHSDADCALHCLVIYKTVVCKGKLDFASIISVLEGLKIHVEVLDKISKHIGADEEWERKASVVFDEKFLKTIANRVPKDWRDLGTELKLDPSVLDSIEVDQKSYGVNRMAFEMLIKWHRSTEGSNNEKVKQLCTALAAIGRKDITQKVDEKAQQAKTCTIL